jgi:hypothetical protein
VTGAINTLAFAGRLGGGDQGGGEWLVEGKEVLDAVPVAGERLGPVAAVHRAVQLLMRLEQRRGHGAVANLIP